VLGTPVASGRHGVVRRIRQAVARLPRALRRGTRRPWWKWLAVTLLVAATVTVTAVYAATLARDIAVQHWANALDASREAVLVLVGWAAVIIVLSARDGTAEKPRPGETPATGEGQDESTAGTESVLLAQDRVRRLRVRLAELSAARERAGSGADPDFDRELATTLARLEQARQWLTSAQSALAARKSDHTADRHPAERTTHRPDQEPADQTRAGAR
jgi:hypothetical protein